MKIQMRHAEPSDFEAIHKIYTQPKVVWGTLQLPYSSAERQRRRLTDPPEGTYTILACVDDEVIGHLSLHTFPRSPRRKHVGSIGMGVQDEWQGRGVGTALMEAVIQFADNWLQILRLELSVYTDNKPGIRLYRKFGFETEGTMRGYAYRGGRYVDVYLMARIQKTET
jgi:putative acetyltransferase